MPVLLFDQAYWRRVVNFEALVDEGMVDARDLGLFSFVETAEEAWAAIERHYRRHGRRRTALSRRTGGRPPRWSELLYWLDLFGVVVFAVSGALEAARKQLDIVGFLFVAAVTGIGGGTLRDLLLDRPVFWLHEPVYLWLTSGAALLTFVVAPHIAAPRHAAALGRRGRHGRVQRAGCPDRARCRHRAGGGGADG